MVEVKIFQDGELKGESKGDFAVCIVSSRKDRKDTLCNETCLIGRPLLKELRSALSSGAARILAVDCRRKGKSMEKACEVIAEFSADTAMAGAKGILDVYEDEED